MDFLKGFHQNVVRKDQRKSCQIISHLGIHEYLCMPFCIKKKHSHFKWMMVSASLMPRTSVFLDTLGANKTGGLTCGFHGEMG